MRGSIRKRGSSYSYWLDLPPDPVTGKRRQKTKGGFSPSGSARLR
jgi:Arm DNA-binding domain